MRTNNLHTWLIQARQRLSAFSETPELELQVLAAHELGQTRTWVIAHPALELTYQQEGHLNAMLDQLIQGVPLPYLTGRCEFYGLSFHVSPQVLIPRPETELLVDNALQWLKDHPHRRCVADVGTGSGIIGVTLAHLVPGVSIVATDISAEALEIARENANAHQLEDRIQFVHGDLLHGVSAHFDLICANLPYIPAKTLTKLSVARHEPRIALDGGPDGLDQIQRLVANAEQWITPGGMMLMEIESSQGESAPSLARKYHPNARISVQEDLSGHPRLLTIQWN